MRNRFAASAIILFAGSAVATAYELAEQQAAAPAATQDSEVSEKLRKVMQANCEANEKEDLKAALGTIHPKSPTYATTEQVSEKLFGALDLKYELVSFRYIGMDDTYAVGRARVKATSAAENQQFRNNTSDLMIAFRKDGDDWKVWSQSILDIAFD